MVVSSIFEPSFRDCESNLPNGAIEVFDDRCHKKGNDGV
jgi:hypothetical protein